MKAKDLETSNAPPSILIYGLAGSGKTALVSQLSKSYLFDFDKGMRTALKLEDKFTSQRHEIEFDIFHDENPLKPRAYLDARKKLNEFVSAYAKGSKPFEGIIIDSLTGLAKHAQLFVQSTGDRSNPTGDPLAKMEIQNWGSLINEIERFLTLLHSLNTPIIVTAHVEIQEAKKEGGALGETIVTHMHPKSATRSHGLNSLGWHFDELLYADRKPIGLGKFAYRVTGSPPNNIIQARSRSDIGLIDHRELGMIELLEKFGYHYGKEQQ